VPRARSAISRTCRPSRSVMLPSTGPQRTCWPFEVEADRCVGVPADELDRAGHILGGRVGQVDPKQVHLGPVEPLDHPLVE
jgi:hypothetical protein